MSESPSQPNNQPEDQAQSDPTTSPVENQADSMQDAQSQEDQPQEERSSDPTQRGQRILIGSQRDTAAVHQEKKRDWYVPGQEKPAEEKQEDDKQEDSFSEIDEEAFFSDYLDEGYRPRMSYEVPELPPIENTLATTSSLADHLSWQLRLSAENDLSHEIGEAIIGNIDDDGYLQA